MKFGIITDYYGSDISVEQVLKRLCKIGIKDVEIPGYHLIGVDQSPLKCSSARKRRIRKVGRMAKELGITVRQMHGDFGRVDLVARSEKERKRNIAVHKAWLDIAALVGAKVMITHPGGRSDGCDITDIKTIREKNIASYEDLAKYAQQVDVKVAVETMMTRSILHLCGGDSSIFYRYGQRISDLLEIVDGVQSGSLGICFDTGHANIAKLDIPGAIQEVGRHLIATHLHDNDSFSDLHLFPFTVRRLFGGIDWIGTLRALRKIHYRYGLIGECAISNPPTRIPLSLLDHYLKSAVEMMRLACKESGRGQT